jgi:uncharacterized membrane protein YdbT with pleckstrin-like domain
VPFPRRLLTDGEELVMDLRPHWIALVMPAAETALLVAAVVAALVYVPDSWPSVTRWGIVAIGVILFLIHPLRLIVAWATSHFVVTSDRVIHRSGWFAKHSMEIPLEKISDVKFHQSVFERLIGAGDLVLESAGEFGQEVFGDVRRPEHVQKTIYEMTEANQRRSVAPVAGASLADEVAKLDRLRDEGVLTEDEFQAEKARLLNRS